jgi:prepilin-type N-terminal cleavage/methylation domain-containing protein
MNIPREQSRLEGAERAFTLVELLAVVAIMAIVMGILAMSLSQGQGRGVQMAAAQVASGMGVARQTAITRNTDALFIIAPRSGSSPTDIFPAEPFRYWSVVYSNRGQNNWTLATDWTEIPSGTVFMGLMGQGYASMTWNTTNGTIPALGDWFAPSVANTAGGWKIFNSATNVNVVGLGNLTTVPFVGFRSTGQAFARSALGYGVVLIGEGAARGEDEIVLRSTNNITHVEASVRSGRIVVRPRDSYR